VELTSIWNCLVKRVFAKNTYLYYPGNPGLNLYLVETGLIRLFFANTHGEEFIMNLVGPHNTVGLPLLKDDQVRIMGAAAQQDSLLWQMSRDDALRLMKRMPQFMLNVHAELAENLRKLGLYAQAHAILNLDGRLANLFLHLTRQNQNAEVDEIEIPLNQSEVASWVAASRGRTNRAIIKMQEMGFIRVAGQRIFILNRKGLAGLADDLVLDRL
jgi:CRP-like cAMP-binding protein